MTSEAIDHPALAAGRVAVITGAASGIGRAVALRLGRAGMRVCLADRDDPEAAAAEVLAAGAAEVMSRRLDVQQASALVELRTDVFERWGEVAFLFNNAAVGGSRTPPWEDPEGWQRAISINLFGVLNGVQAFTQAMIDQGRPAIIVNTGSKQGITSPPGDTAYNVSKAAVKVLTEGLAHSLRDATGGQVTAHLLIPGFTYTGMIARHLPTKPAAAWLPEQVADFLVEGLLAGSFYILCPDNEVTRAQDAKRILWAAGDIAHDRPALSRWHPDFHQAFERFVAEG